MFGNETNKFWLQTGINEEYITWMERFYPVVRNLLSSLLFSRNVNVKCCIKLIFHLILCSCESLGVLRGAHQPKGEEITRNGENCIREA